MELLNFGRFALYVVHSSLMKLTPGGEEFKMQFYIVYLFYVELRSSKNMKMILSVSGICIRLTCKAKLIKISVTLSS